MHGRGLVMDTSEWPLHPGEAILRTVLHDRFGGGRQGGIAHRGRPRTYSYSPTRDRASAMAILTTGRMMAAFTTPAKASVVIKS